MSRSFAATLPLIALLVLSLLAAGCIETPLAGDPSPSPGATVPAPLIAPETLAAHVPEGLAGWQLLAPPSSAVLEEDGEPIVSVTASYLSSDGTRNADLSLQDTGGRSVGLRRLVDGLGNETGGAVWATLAGHRALVLEDGAMAGAYLVVADRYVAWIAVTGGARADLEAFANAMDLEGLAARR